MIESVIFPPKDTLSVKKSQVSVKMGQVCIFHHQIDGNKTRVPNSLMTVNLKVFFKIINSGVYETLR